MEWLINMGLAGNSELEVWPLVFAMRPCGMLRNQMLADPTLLFRIVLEFVRIS